MKVKLKEAFHLQMGKTPSRNNPEYWGDGHRWVSIADIGAAGKHISTTKESITDKGVNESGIKIVPAKTVIMSFKLSIGKVAITSEEMFTNEAIMAFIDKNVYDIDTDFFYHLCCGTEWSSGSNKAVMGLTLNKATLSEKVISLPIVSEQRAIAAELDKIDDIIDKTLDELKLLDQLVKSRFVEMFGDVILNEKSWPKYLFSDIASSRLGKMLDAKQQTGQHSFPYLANFNVQWFRFDLSKMNQMDFNEKDQKEFALNNGDLLVCEGGEIGRCAIWRNEIRQCYFQKALHRVRCNTELVLPEYLAWWFKYNCDNGGFSEIEGAKATISHLPGVKLKALQVAIPPLALQTRFSSFLEQTDKSKFTMH
jgi:type I restriction enzyme S subunit